MRDAPLISSDSLRLCLRDGYGFDATALTFLPLGDTHTAVYRADTRGRGAFFLKLRPSFYEPTLDIPHHLRDLGITAVVGPDATKAGELSARVGNWTAVLFSFIQGDTGWDTITADHWRQAGRIFQRIHAANLPTARRQDIRREAFDPAFYATQLSTLRRDVAVRKEDAALRALRVAWDQHSDRLHAMLDTMQRLSEVLGTQQLPLVVCHADLHPGNLLRDRAGRVHVIDWDDVMLAPKERDFIFTGEPGDATRAASPFFEGYGPVDVDWRAVTYARYERVVTDIIEYASDVAVRSELSDETRLDSSKRFRLALEGRTFAAAEVANARL